MVDPIWEVAASDQLLREIDTYCPRAIDKFVHAIDNLLLRWRADDGAPILSFALQLYGKLGFFGTSDDREARLFGLIAKLDARLSRENSSHLADEIVESALGRFTAPALRRLGNEFARRALMMPEQPWRAQLKILDGLLELDGANNLIENVLCALPNIADVVRIRPAKRRVGDIIVDRLSLPGAAALHDLSSSDPAHSLILEIIRHCVFPGRIEIQGARAVDVLHRTQIFVTLDGGNMWDKAAAFRAFEELSNGGETGTIH